MKKKNEMQNLIKEALEIYDRLMDLAIEEGRGDLYIKYYKKKMDLELIK